MSGLEFQRNWYVLYTKSRQEKSVARKLDELGIEVYCPLKRTKRRWSDRWKWVESPLFTSYCFVRLAEDERDEVFRVAGVVQYVFWLGKPAIVRDEEIAQIKTWLNEYDHEMIDLKPIQPGDKVLIESGPLMDQQGEIVTRQGTNLLMKLESLGTILWVDASKNRLERISGN